MADTKQVSATINYELMKWIEELAARERRSLSQMIEILLEEAHQKRVAKKNGR